MDTSNRPESNLPARMSAGLPRFPASIQMAAPGQMPAFGGAGGGPTPSSSVNLRTILRGLLRHWWHILGLSLILSGPAVYLIYTVVEPRYESDSMLRVEPSKPNLYGVSSNNGDHKFADQYLKTQLKLITSKIVLDRTATSPQVSGLRQITESKDPLGDLSKALMVENIPDTFLIRVAFQSKDPDEAYQIVRAVVFAYMEEVKGYSQSTSISLMNSMRAEAAKLKEQADQTTQELMALAKKGGIQAVVPLPAKVAEAGDGEQQQQPAFTTVSQHQWSNLKNDYIQTKTELNIAQDLLQKKREQADPVKGAEDQQVEQAVAAAVLEQQIAMEFKKDPEVKAVLNDIGDKEKELNRVRGLARQRNEPSAKYLNTDIIALEAEYKRLWTEKYPQIKAQMGALEQGVPGSGESLKELQDTVERLTVKSKALKTNLDVLTVENSEASSDTISAEILRKKLDRINERHTAIDNQLKQSEFEAKNDVVRVTIADEAKKPLVASKNARVKLMAIAPIAVMGAILGLFLMFEIKAERVADPDSLSSRVQSEVFALPPLPSAREVRKMRELESGSDQIDRFIQRLDHLRFAVCGSQASLDSGRCVIITSAVGGEGKTTLAAQLAARCGNAGMSTLLIDADLRRASLGTLLDIPEGPGLSDVLKGDLTFEEVTVPVQGGAFHILLAGTPLDDVSSILQGQNFGILVARLRELYDLILIDSPPILPVPDALILGQWADGAILASRFDVSRFPQVERARRQLDIAGITVLGTVINGMRSSESYYGHYAYGRKKGTQADSSNPI